ESNNRRTPEDVASRARPVPGPSGPWSVRLPGTTQPRSPEDLSPRGSGRAPLTRRALASGLPGGQFAGDAGEMAQVGAGGPPEYRPQQRPARQWHPLDVAEAGPPRALGHRGHA